MGQRHCVAQKLSNLGLPEARRDCTERGLLGLFYTRLGLPSAIGICLRPCLGMCSGGTQPWASLGMALLRVQTFPCL